ncbi:DUF1064 domain-containing protein [Cupriavidus sp. UYPR2.512]|uniref:DUF1064 domain-containing protein n=1 Tax=Cupriavidus sp. UYPR2.512 TaxID=1080187 RepID=UPI000367648A|nr:DUF1064 domain-containing protein [Cupriavidus sp. UYPR2.512]UIF90881.1 DUF1064 domain-containing protein [Cupriavidus necator]
MARWSRKQAAEIAQRLQQVDGASVVRERRNKYGAKKTAVDGRTFDSQGEAARYVELRHLERAGLIENLRCQVPFELLPGTTINGKTIRPCFYVADFVYLEAGAEVIEDFKGFVTEGYRQKRHMMKVLRGIEIRETGKRVAR